MHYGKYWLLWQAAYIDMFFLCFCCCCFVGILCAACEAHHRSGIMAGKPSALKYTMCRDVSYVCMDIYILIHTPQYSNYAYIYNTDYIYIYIYTYII